MVHALAWMDSGKLKIVKYVNAATIHVKDVREDLDLQDALNVLRE